MLCLFFYFNYILRKHSLVLKFVKGNVAWPYFFFLHFLFAFNERIKNTYFSFLWLIGGFDTFFLLVEKRLIDKT